MAESNHVYVGSKIAKLPVLCRVHFRKHHMECPFLLQTTALPHPICIPECLINDCPKAMSANST